MEIKVDVSENEAIFNEYRDLENGLYGKIKLKYDSAGRWGSFNF